MTTESFKYHPTISDDGLSVDPNARAKQNQNPLYENYHRLLFTRLPNTIYACQKVTIPGLSVGAVSQPTGRGLGYWHPGNKATLNELSLTFMVDEKLVNYREIVTWMRKIVPVAGFDTIEPNPAKHFSDAELLIVTSQRVPSVRITLKDCFPTGVDDLSFSSDITDPQRIAVTARFRFNDYAFEDI